MVFMEQGEKQLTVIDHIEELRKRIIIVLVFFLFAFICGLFLARPLVLFLQSAPEAQNIPMNAFKLTDPFKVYLQFAFIAAMVLTSPLALYQLWAFISPGLYEQERKITLAYIPVSVVLFLGGLAFAYFLLFPFVIGFVGKLSDMLNINEMYGINEYFSFLLQLTLPFGFLFQFPIIIMFLTRLGIITPMFLVKIRKYAYFVLLVIAGLITPPEIVSHLMVTVPLLLLYELSIIIARVAYKKALKAQMAQANEQNIE
ncbi:twin-arginine translocase subunit TatC [Pueribacillus theae]|uniref:Sec-independent protein translocase protein TatC n=1 Tax=Pueribacillus theae TaxID=2171751 RepID=A0A2U1JN65_9BACI|nr:twin-arginine translocase subunit TatC [Pueribacillus theae]PWA06333.1 twin-arginine translocase subunit TatC [Pueribacillus theae]